MPVNGENRAFYLLDRLKQSEQNSNSIYSFSLYSYASDEFCKHSENKS